MVQALLAELVLPVGDPQTLMLGLEKYPKRGPAPYAMMVRIG